MEFIFIEDENLIISTYRFHWQSINDKLIKRWDNAPHHKNIKSFPHHLHDNNSVKDSEPMSISKVLINFKNFLYKMELFSTRTIWFKRLIQTDH